MPCFEQLVLFGLLKQIGNGTILAVFLREDRGHAPRQFGDSFSFINVDGVGIFFCGRLPRLSFNITLWLFGLGLLRAGLLWFLIAGF